MTIDLSTLEVGDTVTTPTGGKLEFENFQRSSNGGYFIKFKNFRTRQGYEQDGRHYNNFFDHGSYPLDIIAIEKKPKPVVKKLWLSIVDNVKSEGSYLYKHEPASLYYDELYEIQITDGVPSIERVK